MCERNFFIKRIESLQAQLKCLRGGHLGTVIDNKNAELHRLHNEFQALCVRNSRLQEELEYFQKLHTETLTVLSESKCHVAELERDLDYYKFREDSSISSISSLESKDPNETEADTEFVQVDVEATEPTTFRRIFGMSS